MFTSFLIFGLGVACGVLAMALAAIAADADGLDAEAAQEFSDFREGQ